MSRSDGIETCSMFFFSGACSHRRTGIHFAGTCAGRSWSHETAGGSAHDPTVLGNEIAVQVDALDPAADGAALHGGIARLAELPGVIDQSRLPRIEHNEIGVGSDLQRAF